MKADQLISGGYKENRMCLSKATVCIAKQTVGPLTKAQ